MASFDISNGIERCTHPSGINSHFTIRASERERMCVCEGENDIKGVNFKEKKNTVSSILNLRTKCGVFKVSFDEIYKESNLSCDISITLRKRKINRYSK